MPTSRNDRSKNARSAARPRCSRSDLHVVDEERDERVEVPRVDRHGVAGDELTDLLVREEAVDVARRRSREMLPNECFRASAVLLEEEVPTCDDHERRGRRARPAPRTRARGGSNRRLRAPSPGRTGPAGGPTRRRRCARRRPSRTVVASSSGAQASSTLPVGPIDESPAHDRRRGRRAPGRRGAGGWRTRPARSRGRATRVGACARPSPCSSRRSPEAPGARPPSAAASNAIASHSIRWRITPGRAASTSSADTTAERLTERDATIDVEMVENARAHRRRCARTRTCPRVAGVSLPPCAAQVDARTGGSVSRRRQRERVEEPRAEAGRVEQQQRLSVAAPVERRDPQTLVLDEELLGSIRPWTRRSTAQCRVRDAARAVRPRPARRRGCLPMVSSCRVAPPSESSSHFAHRK